MIEPCHHRRPATTATTRTVLARLLRGRLYDSTMTDDTQPPAYMSLEDVAATVGWSVKTTRTMHHRANQRRRRGETRPGDLPAPDRRIGRTPVWLPETIATFMAQRPGQGAGGGPKPSA